MSGHEETGRDIIAEMRAKSTPMVLERGARPQPPLFSVSQVRSWAGRMAKAIERAEAASGAREETLRSALAPMPSLLKWLVANAQALKIAGLVPKLRERLAAANAALETCKNREGK